MGVLIYIKHLQITATFWQSVGRRQFQYGSCRGGGGDLIFGNLGFLGKFFFNQGGSFGKDFPTADGTVAEGVSLWWFSGK
ncbi:hypothetical protein E6C27_scaffold90G001240 [Cucumis melo var. makuwa]|uniref:Uncharacterized protein n=2 Tax=Cucumis melo TaxID=3656 RepID=A0A5A7VBT9_CUCMM|nr:hypothetical protein E6C27_scaffold90G001240 [Cucumis melo var. makuwa]